MRTIVLYSVIIVGVGCQHLALDKYLRAADQNRGQYLAEHVPRDLLVDLPQRLEADVTFLRQDIENVLLAAVLIAGPEQEILFTRIRALQGTNQSAKELLLAIIHDQQVQKMVSDNLCSKEPYRDFTDQEMAAVTSAAVQYYAHKIRSESEDYAKRRVELMLARLPDHAAVASE